MLPDKIKSLYTHLKKPVFLTLAFLLCGYNFLSLSKDTLQKIQIRQKTPTLFLGDYFRGLNAFVGTSHYLGYYTDKNLDDNRNARQFAQAQLVLAPIILDLNNTSHEFIIFDCSSRVVAAKKIKEIGAVPLKANQYGIILARNPRAKVLSPEKKP